MTDLATVREYLELAAAFYVADQARPGISAVMRSRRRAAAILCFDVLDLLDGYENSLKHLRGMGLVPLTVEDLEPIVQGAWPQMQSSTREET